MNDPQLNKKFPFLLVGIILGILLIIFMSSFIIEHKENAKICEIRSDDFGRLYCNIYYHELEKISPEDKNRFNNECLDLIRKRIDKTASISNIHIHYIKFDKKMASHHDFDLSD